MLKSLNKKGFTLLEFLVALIVLLIITFITFELLDLNINFTANSQRKRINTTEYVFNNIVLYREIKKSKDIKIYGDQIILDNTVYNVSNKTFYKDTKELFKIKTHMFSNNDGLISVYLELDGTDTPSEINLKIRRD